MMIPEAPPGSVSLGAPLGRGRQQTVFRCLCSPALGLARILGAGPAKGGAEASRGGPLAPGENTPLREQACICRQARGGAWGVLTCLFAC